MTIDHASLGRWRGGLEAHPPLWWWYKGGYEIENDSVVGVHLDPWMTVIFDVIVSGSNVCRTLDGKIKDRPKSDKIRELSVAPLLAEAIYRVHKAMPFAELLTWDESVRD